uniref:DNA-directed DNA polymerase n=1 Tax=Meloidogyne hapla TaxID=6305 RepID=A0A1I8C264_MELHA
MNERRKHIKEAGMRPLMVWECKFRKQLEEDVDMALFFNELPDIGPLFPRDAFHGGRTGPQSLKCDLEEVDIAETYEITCYDVVSLYPAEKKQKIGHPEVIQLNKAVDWRRPEQLQPYRGIFKLFIIPPDDLYLPVIPERINGKLIFHLCHQCAIEAPSGLSWRLEQKYSKELGHDLCTHDEKKRGYVATVCTVELELALKKGYRATWIYSVYHWDKWTDKLLRPYVQDMMKLKIQASGWPSAVLDPTNPVNEENLKQEFLTRNQQKYGIILDKDKIARNEGMRYMAKSCNNSLFVYFDI